MKICNAFKLVQQILVSKILRCIIITSFMSVVSVGKFMSGSVCLIYSYWDRQINMQTHIFTLNVDIHKPLQSIYKEFIDVPLTTSATCCRLPISKMFSFLHHTYNKQYQKGQIK